MTSAEFSASNLERANLAGANLSVEEKIGKDSVREAISLPARFNLGTSIEYANLQGANLSGVGFDGTKLKGANLADAVLGNLKTISSNNNGGRQIIVNIFRVEGVTWQQLKSARIIGGLYELRISDEFLRDFDADVKEDKRKGDYAGALTKVDLLYQSAKYCGDEKRIIHFLDDKTDLLVKLNRYEEALRAKKEKKDLERKRELRELIRNSGWTPSFSPHHTPPPLTNRSHVIPDAKRTDTTWAKLYLNRTEVLGEERRNTAMLLVVRS